MGKTSINTELYLIFNLNSFKAAKNMNTKSKYPLLTVSKQLQKMKKTAGYHFLSIYNCCIYLSVYLFYIYAKTCLFSNDCAAIISALED